MSSVQKAAKASKISRDDDKDDLTRQLEDSFPASDPPSMTQPRAKAGAPVKHESVGSGDEKRLAEQVKKEGHHR